MLHRLVHSRSVHGAHFYLALNQHKTDQVFEMEKVTNLNDLRKARLKSSLASLSSDSDIYRLSVPGQGDMVVVFCPKDV